MEEAKEKSLLMFGWWEQEAPANVVVWRVHLLDRCCFDGPTKSSIKIYVAMPKIRTTLQREKGNKFDKGSNSALIKGEDSPVELKPRRAIW